MSERDKTTIGLTVGARDIGTRVQTQEGLQDLMDIAKIGLGLAIRKGIGLGAAKDAVTTWNVGTFDSDGTLRDLIRALYGTPTPYKQLEYLVNSGLDIMGSYYEDAPTSTRLARVLHSIVDASETTTIESNRVADADTPGTPQQDAS